MINLYKFGIREVLVYGPKPLEIPKFLNFELIEENVDLEKYLFLPIISIMNLMLSIYGKRNRDKILEEENIVS